LLLSFLLPSFLKSRPFQPPRHASNIKLAQLPPNPNETDIAVWEARHG